MQRRKFMQSASMAGASVVAASLTTFAGTPGIPNTRKKAEPFHLNYAIHDGLFRNHAGNSIVDQIRYAHEMGFRSFEDNDMRLRDPESQAKIGKALSDLNMNMGVIVGHSLDWKLPTLTKTEKAVKEKFLGEIKEAVKIAGRCGSKHIVVVPGVISHHIDIAYQRSYVMDLLRMATDIAEPAKITLMLEPLNFRDHPGQLLADIPSIYQMVKSVNSPYFKIMFDVYHVQIQSGNIIPNMDMVWDEIAYFQVADNPGRNEPGTGELNYKNIFKHIYQKGFRGMVGMEHSNSKEGKEGELYLIDTYRACDNFLDG